MHLCRAVILTGWIAIANSKIGQFFCHFLPVNLADIRHCEEARYSIQQLSNNALMLARLNRLTKFAPFRSVDDLLGSSTRVSGNLK